jgi:hypothetical protein
MGCGVRLVKTPDEAEKTQCRFLPFCSLSRMVGEIQKYLVHPVILSKYGCSY